MLRLNTVILAFIIGTVSAANAQETIRLKNGMNAPINVQIKSAQQAMPTHLFIPRDGVRDILLEDAGPYSVHVVPEDEPFSGYHLGRHDLRLLAKVKKGAPVELKGEFGPVADPRTGTVSNARTSVYVDAPLPDGRIMRLSGMRMEYSAELVGNLNQPEPKPTVATAVLAVVVPFNARLTIDGTPTKYEGTNRYFSTPPLSRDKPSWYKVAMHWVENGFSRADTRWVAVRPGETTRVNFLISTDPPQQLIIPIFQAVPDKP